MEQIIHAIDEAMLGSWREAAAELRAVASKEESPLSARLLELVAQLERAERQHGERRAHIGQEIGNTLAIAQATIEGMLDGVLQRHDAGLETVHDAVRLAGALLGEIGQEPSTDDEQPAAPSTFDLRSLVDDELPAIEDIAAPKRICVEHRRVQGGISSYLGDLERVRQVVREGLIDIVRSTHPGSAIEVVTGSADGTLVVTIRGSADAGQFAHPMSLNGVAGLLRRLSGRGRVLSLEAAAICIALTLPVASA